MRDPENLHDSNIIKVWDENGDQVGFIGTNRASEFALQIDEGNRVEVRVDCVIGGDVDESYGMLIAVQRYKPKKASHLKHQNCPCSIR